MPHFIIDWVNQLIYWVIGFVHGTIDLLGYWGIVLMMAIESANIPLPSELIMPYAGYMVQLGKMDIWLVSLAGAVGCVVGSVPSYWLGYYGGRPFLEKYGKWLLLSHHDLEVAERWTEKYGDWTFFICRMLPVVRTFISLPAGILKAHFWTFTVLTFVGSFIWCYLLALVGVKLGENLEVFRHYWHKFDYAIITVLLILGGLYVYKHVRHLRGPAKTAPAPTLESPEG